jgi:hypothetical protein
MLRLSSLLLALLLLAPHAAEAANNGILTQGAASTPTNIVIGTGTPNYTARWTGSATIGTGTLYDNGTNVGIGTASPDSLLSVYGGGLAVGTYAATANVGIGSAVFGGWVGLGTPTPSYPLDVEANTSSGTLPELQLTNNYISPYTLSFGAGTNTVAFPFISTTASQLYFKANGATALAINSNAGVGVGSYVATTPPAGGLIVPGNVGIGTASVVNTLGIYGNAAIGASYVGVNAAPSNGLLVQGNVGIGTTSPQNLLDVNGAASIGYNVAAPANGLIVKGSVSIGTTASLANLYLANSGAANVLTIGANAIGHTFGTLQTTADTSGIFEIQSNDNSGTSYGVLALQPSGGTVSIGTTTASSQLNIGGVATGQALCLISSGGLGHCTSVVGASGGCTCAAN